MEFLVPLSYMVWFAYVFILLKYTTHIPREELIEFNHSVSEDYISDVAKFLTPTVSEDFHFHITLLYETHPESTISAKDIVQSELFDQLNQIRNVTISSDVRYYGALSGGTTQLSEKGDYKWIDTIDLETFLGKTNEWNQIHFSNYFDSLFNLVIFFPEDNSIPLLVKSPSGNADSYPFCIQSFGCVFINNAYSYDRLSKGISREIKSLILENLNVGVSPGHMLSDEEINEIRQAYFTNNMYQTQENLDASKNLTMEVEYLPISEETAQSYASSVNFFEKAAKFCSVIDKSNWAKCRELSVGAFTESHQLAFHEDFIPALHFSTLFTAAVYSPFIIPSIVLVSSIVWPPSTFIFFYYLLQFVLDNSHEIESMLAQADH